MTARPGPGVPGLVVQARDHRRGLAAFMAAGSASDPLVTRSGIINAPGSPLRVSQNSPLGMSVLVQPGTAQIHRTGRGAYTVYNDAVAALTIEAAPATNSRWDLVYIAQTDSEVDGTSVTTLGVLKGDVAPSPVKPYSALPAGGLVLAEVGPITSSTTTITDSLIATAIAPYAAVRGAPIPVRNQSERDALASIASASYPITVERLDTGTLERNAGSGWGSVAGVPWTIYTPTFSGITLGNGTVAGRYRVTDGVARVLGSLTLGSSSTVGANAQLVLPVAVAGLGYSPLGSVMLYDSGTAYQQGWAQNASGTGTGALILPPGASTGIGPSVPFTWSANDRVVWDLSYPVA